MIILAPHILAHHLLEGDDSDIDNNNIDDDDHDDGASNRCECTGDSTNTTTTTARPSCSEEADSNNETNQIFSRQYHRMEQQQQYSQQWQHARWKVSMALGSIGAPPLTPSSSSSSSSLSATTVADNDEEGDDNDNPSNLFFANGRDDATTFTAAAAATPNQANNDETLPSSSIGDSSSINLLDPITEMAQAHTELLQTIHRIIEILTDASSIQLGIGPNNNIQCGGSSSRLGVVARAEKSWIASAAAQRRRQKQKQKHHHHHSSNRSDEGRRRQRQCNTIMHAPTLTLHKLRTLLHRAIVDQANSLLEMMMKMMMLENPNQQQKHPSSITAEWWEIYVHDLQHSLQLPSTILTLSQLSTWKNRNGDFLSVLLSNLLLLVVDEHEHSNRSSSSLRMSVCRSLRSSTQFAQERIVYLHSACPLIILLHHQPSNTTNEFHFNDNEKEGGENHDDHGRRGWNNNTIESIRNSDHDEPNAAVRVQNHGQQRIRRRRRRNHAETMIGNVQANLEAARIALWAFGQAYSESSSTTPTTQKERFDSTAPLAGNNYDDNDYVVEEDDSEQAVVWWSQFKDMMERSYTTMLEFEQYLQSATATAARHNPGVAKKDEETNNDLSRADECIVAECSEHVNDATGTDNGNNLLLQPTCIGCPNNIVSNNPSYAGKTLVFSGRSIKQPPQASLSTQSFKSRPASLTTKRSQSSSLHEWNVVDQQQRMLLHDLANRIKTLGLSEEYEVDTNPRVDDDIDSDEAGGGIGGVESLVEIDHEQQHYNAKRIATTTPQSNKPTTTITTTATRTNPSFSISGSLLAELKSTILHGNNINNNNNNITTTCEYNDDDDL
jgi:hypothetical protein